MGLKRCFSEKEKNIVPLLVTLHMLSESLEHAAEKLPEELASDG